MEKAGGRVWGRRRCVGLAERSAMRWAFTLAWARLLPGQQRVQAQPRLMVRVPKGPVSSDAHAGSGASPSALVPAGLSMPTLVTCTLSVPSAAWSSSGGLVWPEP